DRLVPAVKSDGRVVGRASCHTKPILPRSTIASMGTSKQPAPKTANAQRGEANSALAGIHVVTRQGAENEQR
ncbi:hypothetical protein B1218_35200, partial [Pseudomonas ogarae]